MLKYYATRVFPYVYIHTLENAVLNVHYDETETLSSFIKSSFSK